VLFGVHIGSGSPKVLNREGRHSTRSLAQDRLRTSAKSAKKTGFDLRDNCRYNSGQMVNELNAVMKELGGRALLGNKVATQRDLSNAIRQGFRHEVVEELMRVSGLTLKELADALDLSPRSLQRRRRTGRLARFESDRLYRLARIVALAEESLGERQSVTHWLKSSNRALGGIAPIHAIDTEPGAREVENVLGRIAYGGIS
jgi:putative toxin-antitoxin system antitoxin component (TIGR02293 family)